MHRLGLSLVHTVRFIRILACNYSHYNKRTKVIPSELEEGERESHYRYKCSCHWVEEASTINVVLVKRWQRPFSH